MGVPGYDQGNYLLEQPILAGFINVPKLAQTIFDYRTKQGPFAGLGQ